MRAMLFDDMTRLLKTKNQRRLGHGGHKQMIREKTEVPIAVFAGCLPAYFASLFCNCWGSVAHARAMVRSTTPARTNFSISRSKYWTPSADFSLGISGTGWMDWLFSSDS